MTSITAIFLWTALALSCGNVSLIVIMLVARIMCQERHWPKDSGQRFQDLLMCTVGGPYREVWQCSVNDSINKGCGANTFYHYLAVCCLQLLCFFTSWGLRYFKDYCYLSEDRVNSFLTFLIHSYSKLFHSNTCL